MIHLCAFWPLRCQMLSTCQNCCFLCPPGSRRSGAARPAAAPSGWSWRLHARLTHHANAPEKEELMKYSLQPDMEPKTGAPSCPLLLLMCFCILCTESCIRARKHTTIDTSLDMYTVYIFMSVSNGSCAYVHMPLSVAYDLISGFLLGRRCCAGCDPSPPSWPGCSSTRAGARRRRPHLGAFHIDTE